MFVSDDTTLEAAGLGLPFSVGFARVLFADR
jgi:hypothetical protein